MPQFLTAQEEVALARRAARGDRAATDALVLAHLPLVAAEVRRRRIPHVLRDDALQAGALGLSKACALFDPERGTRFAAYAWTWVRREIDACDGRRRRTAPDDRVIEVGDDADVTAARRDGLRRLVAQLPRELEDVVRLRFGWGADDPRPMPRRRVADRLGITVSQVRTREAKAIGELRARLANVGGRAPLGDDPL